MLIGLRMYMIYDMTCDSTLKLPVASTTLLKSKQRVYLQAKGENKRLLPYLPYTTNFEVTGTFAFFASKGYYLVSRSGQEYESTNTLLHIPKRSMHMHNIQHILHTIENTFNIQFANQKPMFLDL